MNIKRSLYSSDIKEYIQKSNNEILGELARNNQYELTDLQRNSWIEEIVILKDQLKNFNEGRILFEYTIPRRGKRIDSIVLHNNIVFLLEFKVGDREYKSSTYDQVYDYALDLKNFQKESHDKLLVPIVVSTEAYERKNHIVVDEDRVIRPLYANKSNIGLIINTVCDDFKEKAYDYTTWENSTYMPTPTIIEAAQALYANHSVEDITRADAGARNLTDTTEAIEKIIYFSKDNHRKSIIFVTGVPGAGKTLVGLNLANSRHNNEKSEHAVFLSGNQPLVSVLQEALTRDKVERAKEKGEKISKAKTYSEVFSFIQIIHKYRDDYVGNDNIPTEKIVIFDEAQRAWSKEAITAFMARRKAIKDFDYSEPEFLISTMDRHNDWAVIVCLIGGGQEINSGEAGMPEWFDSLKRKFKHWDIYTSGRLNDNEYTRGRNWEDITKELIINEIEDLHLATSIRSFRSERVSEFIKLLLEGESDSAKKIYLEIKDRYPIVLTRDFDTAKRWIKNKARGSERYGLLSSSSAARLRPEGIYYAKDRNSISAENWFLNDKEDIRSSYFLEVVASEFEIQGLELDFSIVAWDADLRHNSNEWEFYFISNRKSPPNWAKHQSVNGKTYLKNAYRVLLTRARQGFIIFCPVGDSKDVTRWPEYYLGTYNYLKGIGIEEI